MTDHTSWRVSVTPKLNGSYITPGGIRYEITLHDGATADEAISLIAVLDELADILTPANGHCTPAPKEQPHQDAPQNAAPPSSGEDDGEDVFSVGWVNCGDEFIAQVERLSPAANSKTQYAEVYVVNGKFPLTRIDERFFADIKQATGHDLTTGGELEFDPPREIVFKLSHKNKQNSERHYIDFVRFVSGGTVSTPAWSSDSELVEEIANKISMTSNTVYEALVKREKAGEITRQMSRGAVINLMVAAAAKARQAVPG